MQGNLEWKLRPLDESSRLKRDRVFERVTCPIHVLGTGQSGLIIPVVQPDQHGLTQSFVAKCIAYTDFAAAYRDARNECQLTQHIDQTARLYLPTPEGIHRLRQLRSSCLRTSAQPTEVKFIILITRYIPGTPLWDSLSAPNVHDCAILLMMHQAVHHLTELHAKRILHGDPHLYNFLVARNYQVRPLDFGLSTKCSHMQDRRAAGANTFYSPPEAYASLREFLNYWRPKNTCLQSDDQIYSFVYKTFLEHQASEARSNSHVRDQPLPITLKFDVFYFLMACLYCLRYRERFDLITRLSTIFDQGLSLFPEQRLSMTELCEQLRTLLQTYADVYVPTPDPYLTAYCHVHQTESELQQNKPIDLTTFTTEKLFLWIQIAATYQLPLTLRQILLTNPNMLSFHTEAYPETPLHILAQHHPRDDILKLFQEEHAIIPNGRRLFPLTIALYTRNHDFLMAALHHISSKRILVLVFTNMIYFLPAQEDRSNRMRATKNIFRLMQHFPTIIEPLIC